MQNPELLAQVAKEKKELTKSIINNLTESSDQYLDHLIEVVLSDVLSNEDQEFDRLRVETIYHLTRVLKQCKKLNSLKEYESDLLNETQHPAINQNAN